MLKFNSLILAGSLLFADGSAMRPGQWGGSSSIPVINAEFVRKLEEPLSVVPKAKPFEVETALAKEKELISNLFQKCFKVASAAASANANETDGACIRLAFVLGLVSSDFGEEDAFTEGNYSEGVKIVKSRLLRQSFRDKLLNAKEDLEKLSHNILLLSTINQLVNGITGK